MQATFVLKHRVGSDYDNLVANVNLYPKIPVSAILRFFLYSM